MQTEVRQEKHEIHEVGIKSPPRSQVSLGNALAEAISLPICWEIWRCRARLSLEEVIASLDSAVSEARLPDYASPTKAILG